MMTPSRLPGCVFRGNEGDFTSFECLHPDIKKKVTPDDCAQCPLRRESHIISDEAPEEEAVKPETKLGYLAHGVVGIGKSILGIDRPSDAIIKERWDICQGCEFHRHWQCTACGCLVSAKIRVKSEKCPLGKW